MSIANIAQSALSAFGTTMNVVANNIANVNTDGFKASRVNLESAPQGQGVRVASIQPDTTPGPQVQSLTRVDDATTGRMDTSHQWVQGSNTDLAREFVNMIGAQRGYEANIASARTADEMAGTVLNLVV